MFLLILHRAGCFPARCVEELNEAMDSGAHLTDAGYSDISDLPSQDDWKKILKGGQEFTFSYLLSFLSIS